MPPSLGQIYAQVKNPQCSTLAREYLQSQRPGSTPWANSSGRVLAGNRRPNLLRGLQAALGCQFALGMGLIRSDTTFPRMVHRMAICGFGGNR